MQKILDVARPGVGYATYLGVNESRGEIIIRTDADAVFPKDIIPFIVAMLRSRDKLVAHVGHICGGGFIVYE
ncbi:MAG: hypothetical protein QW096_09310 [Thermofilaceae archaeon]